MHQKYQNSPFSTCISPATMRTNHIQHLTQHQSIYHINFTQNIIIPSTSNPQPKQDQFYKSQSHILLIMYPVIEQEPHPYLWIEGRSNDLWLGSSSLASSSFAEILTISFSLFQSFVPFSPNPCFSFLFLLIENNLICLYISKPHIFLSLLLGLLSYTSKLLLLTTKPK